MDRFIDFFRQMGMVTKLLFVITPLFLIFVFIHYSKFKSGEPSLGVFAGYFCIPQSGEDKPILKNFHIVPLFVSRCESGRFEIDSDLDGLCDSDELSKGSLPTKRFSKHPAVSDGVWWKLSVQQRSRLDSLARACNTGDQDADFLTNCEELILTSDLYEASNREQTDMLYRLNSLNINHPDTDGDGYVDGIEVRFLNHRAPFIFSNNEIGVDHGEMILRNWATGPEDVSVNIIIKQADNRELCYQYELENLESWLPTVGGFDQLTGQKETVKLDFLIYGLAGFESEPEKSTHYGAKVIAINFSEGRFIEKPLIGSLGFSRIGGEAK